MAPSLATLLQAQLHPQSSWQLPEKLPWQLLPGQGLEIAAHAPSWSLGLTLHDLHGTMLLQMHIYHTHISLSNLYLAMCPFIGFIVCRFEQVHMSLAGCQTLWTERTLYAFQQT